MGVSVEVVVAKVEETVVGGNVGVVGLPIKSSASKGVVMIVVLAVVLGEVLGVAVVVEGVVVVVVVAVGAEVGAAVVLFDRVTNM